MTLPSVTTDKALRIYLALIQYPILSTQIRAHMRRELFARGIISQQAFEAEVREQAIRSQAREALQDPFSEEPSDVWELRLMRVRDHLTDFYFAYNLPYELFESLVREALTERGAKAQELLVSFNPELAPQRMLFEQASYLETLPAAERAQAEARLREIKVVLIRTMISDQLAYVNIAKDWFNISDLRKIRAQKIGGGKIGGKSAGMLLAKRILDEVADDQLLRYVHIPESYFLGADVTYQFMSLNRLLHWSDQKYKTEEEIRSQYAQIQEEFIAGEFPLESLEKLRELLDKIGNRPLIVRSSSLLEDNFGTSFAGKYESHFCPNQGTPEQNLQHLIQSIKRIYASILNPDALLYRHSKGLQDYDERMAILIQVVQGERMGRFFLPHAAGVGFSRNLYRWSPEIRREDGFMRMVWGLGTRAVDRVGNDYPRLVALSHPLLQPGDSPEEIRRYSQQYVDLIDLEDNQFKTLPIQEALDLSYPILRYIAQVDEGGYLSPIRSRIIDKYPQDLVITYDELFRRTSLADRMRTILKLLAEHYRGPVDTEFTIHISNPEALHPQVDIILLQCRPQSHLRESKAEYPQNLNSADILFTTQRVVPEGSIEGIRYIIFVPPESYYAIESSQERSALRESICDLNTQLSDQIFICLGPGRWGSTNPDLGVNVGYSDIYNTKALVEISGGGTGLAPEPSFGTHFFQDLVEANIYPLAIYLDDENVHFNRKFFYETPNQLTKFLPGREHLEKYLRLIDVETIRPSHTVTLIMDDEKSKAVAFLTRAEP
jgi:Pyruvate phosphate dikinase, AMP/ATP-binding domain